MAIHILGIRHHGPGSAKNVKAFLESTKPDIVLVEGPPDADDMLKWVSHDSLKPPVAILCYQPDNLQQSVYYPFAEFSPEWQAILYANLNKIPVRFMDLPQAHQFALDSEKREAAMKAIVALEPDTADITEKLTTLLSEEMGNPPNNEAEPSSEISTPNLITQIQHDPISFLAEAAGFDDGEKWWEHSFEYSHQSDEIFDAVLEAMQALREELPTTTDRTELLREAYMRKTIRQAEREMFQNIAVVCGAWHAPALKQMPSQKEDNDLLKGLPKVKTNCTWIPWTYQRLSFMSGYGAGIFSPGWYQHNWKHPSDDGTLWMAKVAQLFRTKKMDTSVAHVIEAVRLANALAALRALNKAGLEELNEATLSILCNGEPIMMSLLNNELIVTNTIGEVPESIPKPPLQIDIEKLQKKLRLPQTADWKDYTLDLRKENDLERSILLHRLNLLDIKWGTASEVSGKGTFKEQWRLQWEPEMSVEIIDKGKWGNTVIEAADNYVQQLAMETTNLQSVCELLQKTIPAELPASIQILVTQINNLAAASGDVMQLMKVIPALVNVGRYGNVRKTDAETVMGIVQGMLTRIYVSLPSACVGIDEEAADNMATLFKEMNEAVNLLQKENITADWQKVLTNISGSHQSSPLIAGYSTRLLTDHSVLLGEALVKVFFYAMSTAASPSVAAAWLEGFLKGSGTLLLIDENLWTVVTEWVNQLNEENFMQVLPLLRRSFANFTKPERRKLGEKVKQGGIPIAKTSNSNYDDERGKKGIAVVMALLGYNKQIIQ